jgi:hypothetical protein
LNWSIGDLVVRAIELVMHGNDDAEEDELHCDEHEIDGQRKKSSNDGQRDDRKEQMIE